MNCQKCQHKNEANSQFCSSCGTQLNQQVVVQKGVPIWAVMIILACCLVLGGLGFAFWQQMDTSDSAITENPVKTDVAADAQRLSTEQVAEQKAEHSDRISLIKDTSSKVFTVISSEGHGTGFLYKEGGYVVTNAHVVEGEVDMMVRNSKGEDVPGTVIGISNKYDIALVKVPAYKQMKPLVSEMKESPVGLEVIAFGSPYGFENTASVGYITGTGRDIEADFIYKQLYQIDAQVDTGSSGGPLVDATTGKVIGINSLVYTENRTFGFSIPLYTMLSTIDDWITNPLSSSEVLSVAGVYNYYPTEVESYEEYYDESELVAEFIMLFRQYYEFALNEGEFYWVADMLANNSKAYNELEDYVGDIAGQGHYFDFLDNTITDVNYSDGNYYVSTHETFDFYSATGDYEYYDRSKTYTVNIDSYGMFQITEINIH